MEDLGQYLPLLDRLVQWMVIPAILMLLTHNRRHNEADKKFIKQEGVIERILSVLEVRQEQRLEDQRREGKEIARLSAAIDKLSDKIDHMSDTRKG